MFRGSKFVWFVGKLKEGKKMETKKKEKKKKKKKKKKERDPLEQGRLGQPVPLDPILTRYVFKRSHQLVPTTQSNALTHTTLFHHLNSLPNYNTF